MKKVLGLASSAALYLTSATGAFAALELCPKTGVAAELCRQTKDPSAGFSNIIQIVINGAFVLAVVAALGYLIYGGIRWILSQGDKSKVEAARNHVIAAIIGLVIVFMSYLILNIVVQIFTGQGLDKLTLPSLGGTD